jgi:lipopolysaccharide transport system ATP-binding protein
VGRDIVINVHGVSKQYRLGEFGRGYGRLTEAITERIKGVPSRRVQHRPEFWALRDISFQVTRGETLGIIGHNGAGKSTLLKVLSRITAPTDGEIRLCGRVGALLEVGTGFHPELTGGENIYLNGAVLGMKKTEIAARFDEIVSFAEVEQFIDTPVKRYSTGMRLRLAFAVAAHLEPDILVVDEVLSVGDLAFQEKCLGRMNSAAAEGRTILFVSHNLGAVSNFCGRCMLLAGGRMVADGPPAEVIERYTRTVRSTARSDLGDRVDRRGNGALWFQGARLEANGQIIDSPRVGQSFDFVLHYKTGSGDPLRNVNVEVVITTELGQMMLHLYSRETGSFARVIPSEGEIRCTLPRCPLPIGRYLVSFWANIAGEPVDEVDHALVLMVEEGDFFGNGQVIQRYAERPALVDHSWSVMTVGAGLTGARHDAGLAGAANGA